MKCIFYRLLNNNEISVLNSGAFGNVPSLERLRLSRNKLTGIEEGVFPALVKLEYL